MTDFNPTKIIDDFRTACDQAGVKPWDAIAAGGRCSTNWWRWVRGDVTPTMASVNSAYEGLRKQIDQKAKSAA